MISNFVLHLGFTIFGILQNSNSAVPIYANSNSFRFYFNGKYVVDNKINSENDTAKVSDSISTIGIHYVIAGSFLIPKNAETQVQKLKKLGFNKCYKYNFSDTEYYSVVVDTFKLASEYIELTESLQKMKVDYFIKTK